MVQFLLFNRAGSDAAPVAAPSGVALAELAAMRDRLERDLGVRVQLQFAHVAPAARFAPALLAA